MYILLNEQSFIGQAATIYDASDLIRSLLQTIKALEPLRGNDPVYMHSTLFDRPITQNHNVLEWIRARPADARDDRVMLLIFAKRDHFIDQIMDVQHKCHFNGRDVSSSSIAGAAHFRGTLSSLQHAPEFTDTRITAKFSTDGNVYEDVAVWNLTHPEQVNNLLRRRYFPSPKHAPGGWGTLMDLTDDVAQSVLDRGVASGRQIYNYHAGRFYEFQSDNAGSFHGYPVCNDEVPPNIRKHLPDDTQS
jgi:hypothetical protein